MKTFRRFTLIAAAAIAVAVSSDQAGAAYSYTSSLVVTSVSGGGSFTNVAGVGATAFSASNGSVVSFQDILTPGSFLLPGSLTANIGNLGVGTVSATPETFTVSYTDTITIINPAPGGATGQFTINGTMTLSNLQNVGGATSGTVSNQYSGILVQGPTLISPPAAFTVNFGTGAVNDFFGPPTIGTSVTAPFIPKGNIGAQINAVPEPTSMTLVALGLTGLLGYARRRRAAKPIS